MAEGGGNDPRRDEETPVSARRDVFAAGTKSRGSFFGGFLSTFTGKVVAGVVALGVLIGGGLLVLSTTYEGGSSNVATPDVPKVKGYRGPVAFKGMKDVYERAKHVTACIIPDDLEEIDRPDVPLRPTARERVEAAIEGVEEIRFHTFERRPQMAFPSRGEFERKLFGLALKEYRRPEAVLTSKALAALGAIPPNTNPFRPQPGSASAIAGVYLPDTKKIFVGGVEFQGKRLLDELTLAHELQHALVDQVHGLPSLAHPAPEDIDSAQAARALIEGDATVSAEQYALVLGNDLEQLVVSAAQATLFEGASGEVPYFLARSFTFPYIEGALFVCELYAIDGWRAVDQAYASPPTTTAEVLFPVRYTFHITPRDPVDPVVAKGWKAQPPKAFGAADLLWLLQAPGGDVDRKLVRDASPVERWNGGELHIFTKGKQFAIALALVDGGQAKEKKEKPVTLCQRVRRWMRVAFAPPSDEAPDLYPSGGKWVALNCVDDQVQFASAPDKASARMFSTVQEKETSSTS